ncbi:MAG: S41 family peptidase, partial [Dehalococcoidia bacterium]
MPSRFSNAPSIGGWGANRAAKRSASRSALLLVALLALGIRPVQASRAAPDPSHLQTVHTEYSILLNAYVATLDPAALLDSAWEGATGLLRRRNVGFATTLPSLSSDPTRAFSTFSTAWISLDSEAGNSIDFTQVAFAADDDMATSVADDHTYFLPPDAYDQFKQELGGADATQIGAGIDSATRPPHVVTDVAPGSGAEQAGILPGDTVIAINGFGVETAAGAAYSDALGGAAGSVVTISVDRPGAGPFDVQVTFGPFHFPIFSAKLLDGGVGYMRLRSFVEPFTPLERGENVVQQLDDALAGFEAAGVTTWVLDLRDDGGGSTATNQAFLGRFLPDGRVDVTPDSRGHHGEDLVDGHAFAVQRPLAVLINRNSASSSEIVASALHEYGRAVLVGRRTAGALGAAQIFPLPDGAGMGVTVATVVSGHDQTLIDNVGVPADILANQPSPADLAAGTDPAIQAALSALAGQAPYSVPASADATLAQADLRAALAPYEVSAAEAPPAPGITTPHVLGDYAINRYNEWNNMEGPGRDGIATREFARQRDWQGALFEYLGDNPLGPFLV